MYLYITKDTEYELFIAISDLNPLDHWTGRYQVALGQRGAEPFFQRYFTC